MSLNIDEFRNRNRPEAKKVDRTPDLQAIAREAAKIETLTHDENWNLFLSYLEASLKASKRHAQGMAEQLRDPMIVNPDQIAKIRASLSMADVRSAVIEEIIAFPKFLLEQGEKAKKQIEEMQRDSA